jgi:hypothetical protein
VVTEITPKALCEKLFPGVKVRIVPRARTKGDSINAARSRLHESFFHDINCATGLIRLENYRKRWIEALGNWSEDPLHDINSHGADAYQTFACGWEPGHEQTSPHIAIAGLTQLGAYHE